MFSAITAHIWKGKYFLVKLHILSASGVLYGLYRRCDRNKKPTVVGIETLKELCYIKACDNETKNA